MRTIKAKVRGRDTTVRVVRVVRGMPHTAKEFGACGYKGICLRLWRCEGRFYTLESEVSKA